MFNREFYDSSLKKQCKLLIVINKSEEQYFQDFLKRYLNKNIRRIIGFDLEYNTPPKSTNQRAIAIFQLCFYLINFNFIIFYSPKIVSNETNDLMHQVLINKNIMKIGHGTDSLDIPALYTYLDDPDKCIKFTNTLYDTRFLCEYMNVITEDKLCNIYFLLEKFKAVDKKQLIALEENSKKLGEFWDSNINITTLSEDLIEYSMNDALYLKKLLANMKRSMKDKFNYKLIVQVTRLVFLLKRNIIKIDDFSKFNLYYSDDRIKLYDKFMNLYNIFINKLDKKDSGVLTISYYKHNIIKILQLKYYLYIIKKIRINKSKTTIIDKYDIEFIENIWNKLYKYLIEYSSFIKIIEQFI